MNLCHLTFELDGHTIAVGGYHHRAYPGTSWEPPEPESFSIARAEILVQANEDDPVSVNDLDEDDLSAAALRAWRHRDAYERDNYASMRREEMRLGARV